VAPAPDISAALALTVEKVATAAISAVRTRVLSIVLCLSMLK
jgi:hypothetical protein